jgi:hypothetical protein
MAELTDMLADVQHRGVQIRKSLTDLLKVYDEFYKEGSRVLNQERVASDGKMAGLEEFYRFVQTVRRNKDVIGSMVRGIANLRPLSGFEVVVEDDDQKSEGNGPNTTAKPVGPNKPVGPKHTKAAKDLEPEHRMAEEVTVNG